VRQPHHVLDLGEHRVGVEVPGDDVLLVQLLEGLIIHLNGVNENAALGEEGAQVAPLRGGHCCKKSNWNPSSQPKCSVSNAGTSNHGGVKASSDFSTEKSGGVQK
jgi:hypothetical protein